MKIERTKGEARGRNTSSAYKDLVWTVATATDVELDLLGQTAQALDMIQQSLSQLGSDKSRIISAQVFLSDISNKPAMDTIWNEWIGVDPVNWPQRACLGVDLEEGYLIEIVVTATRDYAEP